MKKRNVKKYYKKNIRSGWRDYLDLKIPYELLNLNREDFMTKKDIELFLDLKHSDEDTGIVNSYNMLDYTKVKDGLPLNIKLDFSVVHRNPKDIKFFPSDLLILDWNDKFYYLEGVQGYRNPKCVWDDTTNSFPKDEPYWLYDDDEENSMCRFFYTKSNDSTDDKVLSLLTKFKNNKELSSDLFSGNFIYSWMIGGKQCLVRAELFNELSKLSNMCKTTYEEFEENHIVLTFAIRYSDYVDRFLRELKKICVKYKLPKM